MSGGGSTRNASPLRNDAGMRCLGDHPCYLWFRNRHLPDVGRGRLVSVADGEGEDDLMPDAQSNDLPILAGDAVAAGTIVLEVERYGAGAAGVYYVAREV